MATVTLHFASPDNGGSAVLRYEIQWKSGAQEYSTVRQESASTSPFSPHEISGLNAATIYQFRIRAVNGVGNGEWSAPIEATPADTITVPLRSIRLYIGEPDDGGAALTSYSVQWRRESEAWSSGRQDRVDPDAEYWERSGFRLGTTHYLRVRATNRIGNGNWSEPVQVALAVPPPLEGAPVEGAPVEGPPIEGPLVPGPPVEGPPVEGPDVPGDPIQGDPVQQPYQATRQVQQTYQATRQVQQPYQATRQVPGDPVPGPPVETPPVEGPFVQQSYPATRQVSQTYQATQTIEGPWVSRQQRVCHYGTGGLGSRSPDDNLEPLALAPIPGTPDQNWPFVAPNTPIPGVPGIPRIPAASSIGGGSCPLTYRGVPFVAHTLENVRVLEGDPVSRQVQRTRQVSQPYQATRTVEGPPVEGDPIPGDPVPGDPVPQQYPSTRTVPETYQATRMVPETYTATRTVPGDPVPGDPVPGPDVPGPDVPGAPVEGPPVEGPPVEGPPVEGPPVPVPL